MAGRPGSRGRPPGKGGRGPQPAGKPRSQGNGKARSQGSGKATGKGSKPAAEDPTAALRTRLAKVLGRLPETQRNVLEYRMGLVDGHPHNLSDTARQLGLTMHEAKKIEERAFEHIREAIPIQHLQKFLGT